MIEAVSSYEKLKRFKRKAGFSVKKNQPARAPGAIDFRLVKAVLIVQYIVLGSLGLKV
jgi:hypothetical protein